MIRLANVTKSYPAGRGRKLVADDLCATFGAGASVALLGRNGAGKSTLLKMIAGTVNPDRGRILRRGTVSWPVGFGGSFHPDLTGVQNTRFIARVHGVDTGGLVDFVAGFAELGDHFDMPMRTYSSGMRARLAFGLSMGVPFDTYLVDEITAVGDEAFRKKAAAIFRARLAGAGAIVVSHSMPLVREICTVGAVLENGRIEMFGDIDAAVARHEANMAE